MHLPVNPPLLPMLAKRVEELPAGDDWIFEPKWDGFRALIFRDGDEILIQSRDEKPLNRYFPELIEPLLQQLPARCVLDGEIVIATQRRARFRRASASPSSRRIARQAAVASRSPPRSCSSICSAKAIAICAASPFEAAVASAGIAARLRRAAPPPHARDQRSSVAADWFRRFEGAGLDGVMAKPVAGTYESDKRVMLKVKHERDCDCVVAGFRWYKTGRAHRRRIAAARPLRRLRVRCSTSASARASPQQKREELVEFLAPYRENALADHPWRAGPSYGRRATAAIACPAARAAGARARISPGSRCVPSWSSKSPTSTCRARRFRHMAHFRRWRTDKKPDRLHLRAARSRSAARAEGDFRQRAADTLSRMRVSCCATRASDRRPDRVSPARGRNSSGTWRRFTRIRVQVDDLPRIESTSTSSTAR